MKRLSLVNTHPHVIWYDNMVRAKHNLVEGANLGMITGIPRKYSYMLFLLSGCFYLHSELILDARYTMNPLAWIVDGFFQDVPPNVKLIPLCNDRGFVYGLDVVATKDVEKGDPIIYHTMLPI
jgi:hypothetical protein